MIMTRTHHSVERAPAPRTKQGRSYRLYDIDLPTHTREEVQVAYVYVHIHKHLWIFEDGDYKDRSIHVNL